MVEYLIKLPFSMALLFGSALTLVYYFALYDGGESIDTEAANRRIEIGLKEKEKERLTKNIDEGLRIKEKVSVIGDQFKEAFQFLPGEWESDKLISDISKQAQISGATVVKITPETEMKKVDIYETMNIDFELKGSFSSLALFIANISKIRRIIDVQELKFLNNEPDAEAPVLNVTGKMIAYRYLPPAEQEKPQ